MTDPNEPDWLFDRQGPEEPDVAELEALLTPYRQGAPRRPTRAAAGLVALVVLLVAGAVLWAIPRGPAPWSTQTAACDGCIWETGTWLDTQGDAKARIADRGELLATAGARIQLVERGETTRLALQEGRMEVRLNAPPRWLTVRIPGVDVVDLGCAYTLDVAPGGTGILQVTSGSVALEGAGPATIVPAGTLAASWPDGRTGLTVASTASDGLVRAVDAFDRGGAAEAVLTAATVDDAITLWHLARRVDGPTRARVIDALLQSLGNPADFAREPLVAGDADAMDALLGFVIGRTL